MSSSDTVAVVIFLVVYGAWMTVGFRAAMRRNARGISKRLTRRPNSQICIPVASFSFRFGFPAWDPGKPLDGNNRILERGEARYWLDDDGLVHLEFTPQPKRTSGGPRPARLSAGPLLLDGGRQRMGKRLLSAVLAIQVIGVLGGFVAGFALSRGNAAARIGTGGLYAVFGFFIAWFVMHVGAIVLGAGGGFDKLDK